MANLPALQIQRAGPEHAEAVRDLVRAAYARWVPIIGREPLPMTADYAQAVRAHHIDLFHANGEFVALIEYLAHADHLFIENIAIAPAHQRQGLGRILLAHAEAMACKANLAQLRLLTNEAMVANIPLYRSEGFAVDRTESRPQLGATVYMSKTLPRLRAP